MIKLAVRTQKRRYQMNLLQLAPVIASAIDDIKCERSDIDTIYRYVSQTEATNVDRDVIEITLVELVVYAYY